MFVSACADNVNTLDTNLNIDRPSYFTLFTLVYHHPVSFTYTLLSHLGPILYSSIIIFNSPIFQHFFLHASIHFTQKQPFSKPSFVSLHSYFYSMSHLPLSMQSLYPSTFSMCSVQGGADKSLAQPGRQQATATKLGIYSTYSPRSSIHFSAYCSNFCTLLKKNSEGCPSNQVSTAAKTSVGRKW